MKGLSCHWRHKSSLETGRLRKYILQLKFHLGRQAEEKIIPPSQKYQIICIKVWAEIKD